MAVVSIKYVNRMLALPMFFFPKASMDDACKSWASDGIDEKIGGCKVERVVSWTASPSWQLQPCIEVSSQLHTRHPILQSMFFRSLVAVGGHFRGSAPLLEGMQPCWPWGFAGSVADASLPRRLGLGWSLGTRSWSPSIPGSHMNHLSASKKLHTQLLNWQRWIDTLPIDLHPWVVCWVPLWFHSDSTVIQWCRQLFDPRTNYSWTLGCASFAKCQLERGEHLRSFVSDRNGIVYIKCINPNGTK